MSIVIPVEQLIPSTPASGYTNVRVNGVRQLATTDDAGTSHIVDSIGLEGSQVTPLSPTQNGGGAIMAGLAGSFTPKTTGRMFLMISGNLSNTSGAGSGTTALMKYGTGTTPKWNNASTGTSLGTTITIIGVRAANDRQAYRVHGIVTGLVVGTSYWFDLVFNTTAFAFSQIANTSMTAIEL